jgi:(2Fe-2S) ferredoxin
MQNLQKKLFVCTNHRFNPDKPSCGARGSKALIAQLNSVFKAQSIFLSIEEAPCLGLCQLGPNVRLIPNGEIFNHVSSNTIQDIVNSAKEFLK